MRGLLREVEFSFGRRVCECLSCSRMCQARGRRGNGRAWLEMQPEEPIACQVPRHRRRGPRPRSFPELTSLLGERMLSQCFPEL